MNIRPVILAFGLAITFASVVRADITIDNFSDAGSLPQLFGPGNNNVTDNGLGGVLGGTRSLTLNNGAGAVAVLQVVSTNPNFSPHLSFGGPAGAGSQDLTIAYSPGGADFTNVTSIDFSIDLATGTIANATFSINGIDVSGTVNNGLNTISIPIADFVGLTLNNITSISLTLNGTGPGLDYDVSGIVATQAAVGGGGGAPVPEPSSALLCLGFAVTAEVTRRRRRRKGQDAT